MSLSSSSSPSISFSETVTSDRWIVGPVLHSDSRSSYVAKPSGFINKPGFQSLLFACIFSGAAMAAKLPREKVVVCGLIGASLVPAARKIKKSLECRRVIRTKAMTIEDALKLLNVSLEHANNIEIIEAKYQKAKKAAIPRRELGSTSQMNALVDDLLQDIEKAYALLKSNQK